MFTARRFQSVLTPGITRPQAALIVDDNLRFAGRVHADVRPPHGSGTSAQQGFYCLLRVAASGGF